MCRNITELRGLEPAATAEEIEAALAEKGQLLIAEPPDPRPPCPCCGGTMIIIETIERRYLPRGPPCPIVPSGNLAS